MIFKLLSETHKGLLTKAINHNLGKQAHIIPNPSLQYLLLPQGSTDKLCLTHSSGTARKMTSIEAKAQTNLSPPQRSPMLGPLALLPFLRASPLLHWKHRQGWPPVLFPAAGWGQRKEVHVGPNPFLSSLLTHPATEKAVSNPSRFRTPPQSFHC